MDRPRPPSPKPTHVQGSQDGFTAASSQAPKTAPPLTALDALQKAGSPKPRPAPRDDATISFSRINDEIEFKYNDVNGKPCGPYIVTITPVPDVEIIANIQGALINLIDLARCECGDFESVSFSGGLSTGQPASARVTQLNKEKNSPSSPVNLGGSDPANNGFKPAGYAGTTADYIDEQLQVLKRHLLQTDGHIKVSMRKAKKQPKIPKLEIPKK
jgi:hypothetical protein